MRFWQSRRASIIVCVVLAAGTVGIGWPLDKCNTRMREKYVYAFPDLQNFASADCARTILGTWEGKGKEAIDAIRGTMRTDLVFAVFYAPLAALLAYRATLLRRTPWVARLGRGLAWGALVGGLADLVENAIMFRMLVDANATSWLPLLYIFTGIKIAGAMMALLYVTFSHLDS